MDVSRSLTDRHKMCNVHISLMWGDWVKPENLPANFFPAPKKLAAKNSNFAEHPPTRRQLETCNFETVQHVDK